jgi:outer membrane receptor for ferrienterochelin and colicins
MVVSDPRSQHPASIAFFLETQEDWMMCRLLRTLIVFAFLLLSVLPIAWCDQIQGTVNDDTGKPIAGVSVIVEEAGNSTRTDRRGVFVIRGLEPGSYRLKFVAAGFEEQVSDVFRLSADGRRDIDVTLAPVFRSEIVVTGTRTEKRLVDVPVRTEVITRQDMEQTAARTLAEALDFSTGVRVESNCQNCNFQQVRLLGLDGNYTQILIDGQPLVSSLAQVYGVEHFSSRMIESIEIVKGGGSSLYGAGSVGGVINVIPSEPTVSGGAVETRYENQKGNSNHSVNAMLDHVPSDQFSLTLFGQYDSVEPLDIDGDGYTEVSERDLKSFGLRMYRRFLEGDGVLAMDYNRVYEQRRGGDNLDLPEFMANVAEAVTTNRHVASISWSHFYTNHFKYKASLSLADTNRDTYYGAGMDPNAYGKTENPLVVFDTQFDQALGKHLVSYGLQYSADDLKDTQTAYNRMTDETYTNMGLFIQDNWMIDDQWELVAGIRGDKHSEVDHLIASPRVAMKWRPADDFITRLSVASGFQAPQVFNEDLHITQVGGEGAVIRNDPDLVAETSWSYNLGFEWTPRIASGFGLVELNTFYTAIDDLFNIEEADNPDTPEIEFSRVNYGKAAVYGAELNLGFMIPKHFKVDIGYVEQRSRFDEPEPDFGSKTFFRSPERYGVLNLTWMNLQGFDIFVGCRYTGKMKVPHYAGYIDDDRLETTPSFLTVDAGVTRTVTLGDTGSNLKISAGGKNLTNQFQDDLDQGPDRDAGYVYGPRFPRSYYLSLSYSF